MSVTINNLPLRWPDGSPVMPWEIPVGSIEYKGCGTYYELIKPTKVKDK